jgi:hypothetical protein
MATAARAFAATAMFAGLAIGAVSTARADPPTMNGNYTETSTSPSGRSTTTDWTVQACSDGSVGCIYVKAGAGGGQAHLIDGQWVMDTMGNLLCPDGTFLQYVTNAHLTWCQPAANRRDTHKPTGYHSSSPHDTGLAVSSDRHGSSSSSSPMIFSGWWKVLVRGWP